jgi:Family of unknown function (DUF6522)
MSARPALPLSQSNGLLVFELTHADINECLSLMREGAITSSCERGIEDDAGRYRLIFFYKSRRLRLIIDEAGRVIQRSTIEFNNRPLPARLHRRVE